MQAKIKTQAYETFEPVFDGSFEAPIDAEYDLPDYCPDVRKILKCQADARLSSYLITEEALRCEGVCRIRVLYLDAKGDQLRCCEFTKDFSASVKVRAAQEKAVAWVTAAVQHLNCRAVSARRLDLHLAVGIRALAVVQRRQLLTSEIEEESIEKQGSTWDAAQAVNAISHQFTVEDELFLKNGKPPIESILRESVSVRLGEHRVGEDSLTVSGALELSFLYLSALGDGAVEKMSATVEFSQVIDCAGAAEDCLCDLRAVVGEVDLRPKEDDMGECTGVELVARVFVTAFLYQPCTVRLVDDAYSTRGALELRTAQAALARVESTRDEVVKKKLGLTAQEDGIEQILDLWVEQESAQASLEKGKLTYRLRCTVGMLYQGAEGRVLYAEKALDQNIPAELPDDRDWKAEARSQTEIWEYRIADKNTVELSLETRLSAFLTGRDSRSYLSGVQEAEEAAAGRPGLCVYYALPGERVWDIAKSHRAQLSRLRAANELYEDTVPQGRPILIFGRA